MMNENDDNADVASLEKMIRPTLQLSKCTERRIHKHKNKQPSSSSRKRRVGVMVAPAAAAPSSFSDNTVKKSRLPSSSSNTSSSSSNTSKHNKQSAFKTAKRQRTKHKLLSLTSEDDNIPIPSFSPVFKLDDMDVSILDSPPPPLPRKAKTKEGEETNSTTRSNRATTAAVAATTNTATTTTTTAVALAFDDENDDDDDDEDDALLDGPPIFASCKQQSDDNDCNDNHCNEYTDSDHTSTNHDATTTAKRNSRNDSMTTNSSSSSSQKQSNGTFLPQEHYEAMENHVHATATADDEDKDEPRATVVVGKMSTITVNATTTSSSRSSTTTTAAAATTTATTPVDMDEQDDLIVAIDSVFKQINLCQVTFGEFVSAVEAQLEQQHHPHHATGGAAAAAAEHDKLPKASRALVKARLSALLSGRIEPTVSALPNMTEPPPPLTTTTRTNSMNGTAASLLVPQRDGPSTHSVNREEEGRMVATQDQDDAATAVDWNDDDNNASLIAINDDDPSCSRPHKQKVPALAATTTTTRERNETKNRTKRVDSVVEGEQETLTDIAAAENRPPSPPVKKAAKPRPKKRGRPPKKQREETADTLDKSTLASTQSGINDGDDDEESVVEPQPPPKKAKRAAASKRTTGARTSARTRKGTCALCTTCTCTIGKETSEKDGTPASTINMSRTDAQIERALIKRAKKLELVVDKYQSLLDQVNRELKKQRRMVWKKQEAQLNNGKRLAFGDSRFLPDADIWNEQAEAVHPEALPIGVVQEAKGTVFGSCQPTLTQMFGSRDESKETANQETSCSTDSEVDKQNAPSCILEVASQSDKETESVVEEEESVTNRSELNGEADPIELVHRLCWRKGTKVNTQIQQLQGSGAWSALTTKAAGPSVVDDKVTSPLSSPTQYLRSALLPNLSQSKYNCAWDALFSDESAEDDTRMDQLLHLFENESLVDDDKASQAFSQQSEFDTVLLSQRGEIIADSIEGAITADPTRRQSIEGACPRWRENIRYALAQRGTPETRKALEGVRRSLKNLQATKDNVTAIWNRQGVVLQLFEASLSASLSRLAPSGSPDCRSPNKIGDEAAIASPYQQVKTTALSPILEGDDTLTC